MTKLPIHESATSDKVVAFITLDDLPDEVVELNNNNNLWGLYYKKNKLIAADIWGATYEVEL